MKTREPARGGENAEGGFRVLFFSSSISSSSAAYPFSGATRPSGPLAANRKRRPFLSRPFRTLPQRYFRPTANIHAALAGNPISYPPSPVRSISLPSTHTHTRDPEGRFHVHPSTVRLQSHFSRRTCFFCRLLHTDSPVVVPLVIKTIVGGKPAVFLSSAVGLGEIRLKIQTTRTNS